MEWRLGKNGIWVEKLLGKQSKCVSSETHIPHCLFLMCHLLFSCTWDPVCFWRSWKRKSFFSDVQKGIQKSGDTTYYPMYEHVHTCMVIVWIQWLCECDFMKDCKYVCTSVVSLLVYMTVCLPVSCICINVHECATEIVLVHWVTICLCVSVNICVSACTGVYGLYAFTVELSTTIVALPLTWKLVVIVLWTWSKVWICL